MYVCETEKMKLLPLMGQKKLFFKKHFLICFKCFLDVFEDLKKFKNFILIFFGKIIFFIIQINEFLI